MNIPTKLALLTILLVALTPARAQIPAFPLTQDGLAISRTTQPLQPFTVAGTSGVLVGSQDGQFESWILPIKLLSHLTIEANLEGYSVPIPVNPQSAQIEVYPDHTTITYAHLGFTIRQIMFSPDTPKTAGDSREASAPRPAPHTGPVVLFQIEANHPLDLTFRFTPEMRWMWPKRNEGIPSPEWVKNQTGMNPTGMPPVSPLRPGDEAQSSSDSISSGFYLLHLDYPNLVGAITIPTATPGILAPYQERPQVHPLELHLHYDPKRDADKYFPLLMAVSTTEASSTKEALGRALSQLNTSIPTLYAQHAAQYQKLFSESTSIVTPDQSLNQAFQWAIASIEQLKADVPQFESEPNSTPDSMNKSRVPPVSPLRPGIDINSTTNPSPITTPETALVAGYYASGDSARPGFGWFFGRDSLYTLYAVNSYGDFALTRAELQFLIARQRPDGKIMHEFAQTAADPSVHWQDFDYMYAAADATPLFLMAVRDYYRASGDKAFLESHQAAIEKAWAFETAPTSDTDHDGIYDNSQGTGWVESWRANQFGDMPHQEVYLALLDEQASQAYAAIQTALGDQSKATTATTRATRIQSLIESEYYDPAKSCYAFSHNPDGSQDKATTVYPAIAWWDQNPPATNAAPETSSAKEPDAPSMPQTHRDMGGMRPNSKSSVPINDTSSANQPNSKSSVEGHDFSRANQSPSKDGASAPAIPQPLAHPEKCLEQLAAPTLATDWGLRDVATTEPFYDGMSYHQGSVWPLFTGWGSLAEYRANQPLPAQQMLMQNVDLTWAQDPGAVTELLSGDFFVPFGRSTSHQLWSSAMVITPTLRGLFGINLDATTNTITLNPHLPASWNSAEVSNLRLGDQLIHLTFKRENRQLIVTAQPQPGSANPVQLQSDLPGSKPRPHNAKPNNLSYTEISIPLPAIEPILPAHQLPIPGNRPSQLKVLSNQYTPGKLTLVLEGQAGATEHLYLRDNATAGKVKLEEVSSNQYPGTKLTRTNHLHLPDPAAQPLSLDVQFPKGQGWQTVQLALTW